jgi:PAS domain S-box-containing protein
MVMDNKNEYKNATLRNYFDDILDLVSEGIYITDRQGLTLRVNRMYERMTGLKKSVLEGRNVETLKDSGIFDTILNPSIVETKKPDTKIQTDRRGKKLVLSGYPILAENGEVALVVTFVRDTSLMAQLREQIVNQRKLLEKYRTNVQYINFDSDQKRPLIAKSPAMSKLIRNIENLAGTDATILLQGETGVGKDIFARRIHRKSTRSDKPFVKVDCPTIPESLFESELFGYEPGAFSGAHAKGKLGFLEMADKGTLFLDEIGELPIPMQAKLLRVLQDREIIRVGSTKTRKVDVRVVSATNRDLEEEVKQGRFRGDLFYRLRVIVVKIPPLRERHEDILPLAEHFMEKFTHKYKKLIQFSPDILPAFHAYHWPGNVREMENLIQSLVITNRSRIIEASALPSALVPQSKDACQQDVEPAESAPDPMEEVLELAGLMEEIDSGTKSLKSIMNEIERRIITYALPRHDSYTKLAERFKVNRSTLFRKLNTKDG